MFADTGDHLFPHLHDLKGESQAEVAFNQLADQRIARLLALCKGRLLLELRSPVGHVDLAA